MRGLWPTPLMNDKTKRNKRKIRLIQGHGIPPCKKWNAPNIRGRCPKMEDAKPEEKPASRSRPKKRRLRVSRFI